MARRVVGSVVVVLTVGIVLRVAAARPLLAASAAAVVSLGAVALGLLLNIARHGPAWRRAWVVLALSLAFAGVATTVATTRGLPTAFPAPLDWATTGAAVLAGIGIAMLLHSRTPGRAFDATLEGAMVAVTLGYVPWAWAVTRGVDHTDAALVLAPVAAWTVVVWLTGRLLLLTDEHPFGYRYLGASFLCLLVVDAVLAGAELGGNAIDREQVMGFALWAFCLWGISALHPSLRLSFEPAEPRPSVFGFGQLIAIGTATLVAPATLVVIATGDQLPRLDVLVSASAVLPLLLAVYLIRQVQDRSRAEYRAQHDPLTGLPNRVLFHDRVDVALGHARRSGSRAAVLFLDLDRFKSINDSLGHLVGNQLLQSVSKRLTATLRETDTIARMGGDEFTVLIGDLDSAPDAVVVAQKLLDAFSEPFVAGGRELYTTTSIGVAVFPEDGDDADTLLKHADSAMYLAKAQGRAAYQLFTSDLSVRAQAKLSLESGLRHALEREYLTLHYQPQVDARTGSVVGLEALARWPHRSLGMVSPGVFVPIAEETGLIVPLGEWALDQVCAQTRAWLDAGITPRPVAVNISARQFSQESMVDTVAEILERHRVAPTLLELEITESIFMRDLKRTTSTLEQLRDMGVRCSIDDFGTGFSGLNYLADMPIDSLKIDQSFVSRITSVDDDAPIIEAIIALARSLGLNVIAEGVETEAQARFLMTHGCAEMQGYFFSPPLPVDDIEHLLLVDDATTIAWLPSAYGTDRSVLRALAGPAAATPASRLLWSVCTSDDPVDVDADELARVLAALVPPESTVPEPSALRAASMRLAAGTFVGLMPVSTGLAAAGVLPGPAQSLAASVFDRIGIDVPDGGEPGDGGRGDVILADSRHTEHAADPDDAADDVHLGLVPAGALAPSPTGPDDDVVDAPDATIDTTPVAATEPAADPPAPHVDAAPTPPVVDPPTPPVADPPAPPVVDPPTPPVVDPPTPPAPGPGHGGTPPGHSDGGGDAPGNSGSAPGHGGTPPGHGGTPPGHSDGGGDAPGHSGDAPGHSGDAPGHSGDAPGHSGDAPGSGGPGGGPGNSEHAPGHGGTPPGHGGTPPGHAG